MNRPAILGALLLASATPALAQTYPSPSYQNLHVMGQQAAGRITSGAFGATLLANTAHDEIIGRDGIIAAGSTAFFSASASFAAGDVGKTIIIDGAGPNGTDLQTTIASITDLHDVILTTAASNTTPWWSIGRATLAASSVVTSSYAVGDTVTAVGGTQSGAGAFQVASLQANNPTVASGGSGGANGACTVIGTTGVTRTQWGRIDIQQTAGNGYFTASGTVSGGALTGPLTIQQAGDYSTVPSNQAAEPVLPYSGCAGLTGATVSIKMAPHYMIQTQPGHYAALPANPVATTTSGSGAGATLSLFGTKGGPLGDGTSNPGDQVGGYFAYGTDDTAAINSAIATVMSEGGGTVQLPAGRSLVLGALVIPYTGSAPPVQSYLELVGAGNQSFYTVEGNYQSMWLAPLTGSMLDMRYAGTGNQVAKIDTRGMGAIRIDRLTLADYGTDNFLFFQTTNTQPFIDHTTFLGNPTCYEMTCHQDAIRLGGITNASTTLSTDAPTDGYQSNTPTVDDNFAGNIQELVQFGGSANSGHIANNQVDSTSGSWTTAPYHFYGAGFGASGNTFYGGQTEVQGYPFEVLLDTLSGGTANTQNAFMGGPIPFDGSGLVQGQAGIPTIGGFDFASGNNFNVVNFVGVEEDFQDQFVTQDSPAQNTVMTAYPNSESIINSPLAIMNKVGIDTLHPVNDFEYGDGTGNRVLRLNGGDTNPGDGASIIFGFGGNNSGYLGNVSSIIGGSFNNNIELNSNGDLLLSVFTNALMTLDFTSGVTVAANITANDLINAPSAVQSTPASGATITYAAQQRLAIVQPAGPLAALTLQLPACAANEDGQERLFKTTQPITAFTVNVLNSGPALGMPTTAAPGTTYVFHCLGSDGTWY